MRIRCLVRFVHTAVTVVILGPALASARPPNAQRNYGMLGNVLASLVDVIRSRFGATYEDTRNDMKTRGLNRRNRGKDGKRKGYGPLGRLLVTFIGESLGYGGGEDARAVSVQDADPHQSFIEMAPEGTVSAGNADDSVEKQPVSYGRKRLQGLRELLKVLWSNFLPDPTFDLAVQNLKQRDAERLDMVSEAGVYISALQREQLLAWAGECTDIVCTSTKRL